MNHKRGQFNSGRQASEGEEARYSPDTWTRYPGFKSGAPDRDQLRMDQHAEVVDLGWPAGDERYLGVVRLR